MTERYDFFVSYTASDKAWAEWIAWQLETDSYRVLIQAWDFAPGSNWVHEMNRGLANADRMVAVLSPAYLDSGPASAEWAAAFAEDPKGGGHRLVPVRIQECELTPLARTIVYIDLVGHAETEARRLLLEGVRPTRRPVEPPKYPGRGRLEALPSPRFPGSLPPVWNLPARNMHFVGRDQVLADLATGMAGGGTRVITQALAGLGGIGKSSLALEYAYRHIQDLDVGWWITADQQTTMIEQFAALGGALGLPVDEGDLEGSVHAVRRWLEDHDRWMVVFDNAEDPPAVRNLLPRAGHGRVLITSRRQDWSRVGATTPVESLPRGVAAQFLMDRSGDNDPHTALELADELGGLPLALEQAGSYVAHTITATLASYLELFRQRSVQVFEGGRPLDYEHSVLTTWTLALEQIRDQSPPALELLRLLAFLAPDDIPVELVAKAPQEALPAPLLSLGRDTWALEKALATLTHYSLLGGSADALSMHRLVQAVTRAQLLPEEAGVYASSAVRLIARLFPRPGAEVSEWPQCLRLYPHAITALDLCTQHEVGSQADAGALLHGLAAFQRARGSFIAAREHLLVAVAHYEEVSGSGSQDALAVKSTLGLTLLELGELAAARDMQEHVLAARTRILGEDHRDTLAASGNLAVTLWALGELAAARDLEERVLAARTRILGEDHPDTLAASGNLAETLRAQGELAAARDLQERVLAASRRILGEDHPGTLGSANNLAGTLRAQGELAAARDLQEHVLAASTRILGEDHPDTFAASGNLAETLRAQGELAAARDLQERVLAARTRILGEDHPDTFTASGNLAATLRAQGELAAARDLQERVLAARTRILGEDHPDTLAAADNLATTLRDQGEPTDPVA